MKRCTLLIPDAGPLNSLWVAGRLDLLLRLDMPIIVVDAVYDEVTRDPQYPKDADVKDFIDGHRPPFIVEETEIGILSRERRDSGLPGIKHAGELAIMSYARPDGGVQRHLQSGDPLLVLFEDHSFFLISRPRNMHLLSTVGLLRGLERAGVISSADAIVHDMLHPAGPSRRPEDARVFTDLPKGTDEPADVGSSWEP